MKIYCEKCMSWGIEVLETTLSVADGGVAIVDIDFYMLKDTKMFTRQRSAKVTCRNCENIKEVKEEKGEYNHFDLNNYETIPCPDNKPGCLVLHYKSK